MHGELTHFAFNADDLPASRRFYESLFGWRFEEAYPGFLRTTSAGAPIGAIQGRRSLLGDLRGPECSFEVDDLAAAATAAQRNGGRIVMSPATIPGVGELAFVADPGANVLGLIRFSDGSVDKG
jgi:predicted enzyme related to lactoylglutathione lyase